METIVDPHPLGGKASRGETRPRPAAALGSFGQQTLAEPSGEASAASSLPGT